MFKDVIVVSVTFLQSCVINRALNTGGYIYCVTMSVWPDHKEVVRINAKVCSPILSAATPPDNNLIEAPVICNYTGYVYSTGNRTHRCNVNSN